MLSAAFEMSHKYAFASRSIKHLLLLGNALENVWVSNRPVFDQIDGAAQEFGKRLLQAKVILHPDCHWKRFELDQKICVAPELVEIGSQNGAESRQSLHLIDFA